MIAKRASGHGSARLGELRLAGMINGIDTAGQVPGTRLRKAKQHPIAVRDRPLVTAAPAPPGRTACALFQCLGQRKGPCSRRWARR